MGKLVWLGQRKNLKIFEFLFICFVVTEFRVVHLSEALRQDKKQHFSKITPPYSAVPPPPISTSNSESVSGWHNGEKPPPQPLYTFPNIETALLCSVTSGTDYRYGYRSASRIQAREWFQLLHMTREFIKCLLQRVLKLLLPLDHNDHFPENILWSVVTWIFNSSPAGRIWVKVV